MLDMTAKANSGGAKFEGVDLFLFDPHVSIDSTDDDLKRLADKIRGKGLAVGSVVAPVWPPTGGGSAMGSDEDRKNFLTQVRKACSIAKKLRDNGIRKYGVVRIDSAASPSEWAKDPAGSTKKIAETFRQACDVAELCIAVDGAGQCAQTLLARNAAEISHSALTQLDVFFVFGNADEICCGAVGVVVARDTAKRASLQFARRHRLE